MENIFEKLYKPDVLSCLADLSNDEVFTPPEVANKMLDLLPQEIFSCKETKILDPACKSGVFLREAAKRFIAGERDQFGTLQECIDWIFHHQLYGIAITELTSLLSRRSVYCAKYPNSPFSVTEFEKDNVQGNILYHRTQHKWIGAGNNKKCSFCGANYSGSLGAAARAGLETHAYEWIHIDNPEDIFNMKFDVIISNPPYQLETGGGQDSTKAATQAKPIYHRFIQQAKKLNPRYMCMIVPARWYSGGIGLSEFRENMLNDRRITTLVDYINSKDCFNGVDIAGGVCYFLWERDSKQDDNCTIINISGDNKVTMERPLNEFGEIFIRSNEAISIIYKIMKKCTEFWDKEVSAIDTFGIPSKEKGHKDYRPGDIKLLHSVGSNSQAIDYVSRDIVKKNPELIEKYKIKISIMVPQNGEVGINPENGYTINVCAGTAAGVGLAALDPVRRSMNPALGTKSITLSCGKLTTGVTVKPWSGIFMLRNLSSPETYFQAAFRVQSPWTMENEDGSVEIMKKECYVFDFAIDRALRQIADYSCKLDVKEQNPEKKVAEFVNFLPVLAYDGSKMMPVSAADILDMTMAGTSATLLARRWESALLVNVDNETLQRILDNPDALAALNNIEGFRALNKDIETIINRSNAIKNRKKSGEPLTRKEKKELTDVEKEIKSKRKMIQEKLIKFATRIPIFMYLSDFREMSLKDVITQFEPNLFRKVTGLTIKDFELLVSLNVFNDAVMNDAVYHFKRYEDASLEYTGINKHASEENVGLFSTVISKEEYERMDELQKASMASKARRAEAKERRAAKKEGKGSPVKPPKTKPTPMPTRTVEPAHPAIRVSKPVNAPTAKPVEPPKATSPEIDFSSFAPGVKVKHSKFGAGVIMKISSPDRKGESLVHVKFNTGGEKSFTAPSVFQKGLLTKEEG